MLRSLRDICLVGTLLAFAACASSDSASGRRGPERDVAEGEDTAGRDVLDDSRSDAGPGDDAALADADDTSDSGGDAARDTSSDLATDTVGADVADAGSSDAGDDVSSDAADGTDGAVGPDTDGRPDAGGDASDAGAIEPCEWAQPIAQGADRPVLVGHRFTEEVGVAGTDVRRLTLQSDGTLVDHGVRLDVGFRPQRIEILPSGRYALVLGEREELVVVSLGETMEVVDRATLPSAGFGDIRLEPETGLAFIVGQNSTDTGGISTVRIHCDGTIDVLDAAFFEIRLATSLAWVGRDRAVLLGGQALFEPRDPDDIRLLERAGSGWRELGAFDIYADHVFAGRIAASPSGDRVLVPNGSAFSSDGATVSVLAVDGDVVREVNRLAGYSDASEAVFSPDGQAAMITRVEPGRVMHLRREDDGTFTTAGEIRGIGLPDQMDMVERGPLAGLVLIPSVDVDGTSNIAMLRFGEPGEVEDLGQLDLGTGSEEIPGPIGLVP